MSPVRCLRQWSPANMTPLQYLHLNGERVEKGQGCRFKVKLSALSNFQQLLDEVTVKLGLHTYARKLFLPDGGCATSSILLAFCC